MVDLYFYAARLQSEEDKARDNGTGGGSTLAQSLAHAANVYSGGYVDDSNGAELALILATLSKHAGLFSEWLSGAENTLRYAYEDGGLESLNHGTMSPFPSFDTATQAESYLNEMRDAAQAMRAAFDNAPKTKRA